MKLAIAFLMSVFAVLSANAAESCVWNQQPRVFVVGEIHGTEPALALRNLMMKGALKDRKIYHGLEIDAAALNAVLNPQFHGLMYGMEEPFSKGFGVIYWSWFLSKKHFLMKTLPRDPLSEAVASFHYFLLSNAHMQNAWKVAKLHPTITVPKFPEVKDFVMAIDQSLATQIPADQAGLPIPLDNENRLAATEIVLKAVMRAYVDGALLEAPDQAPKYIPGNLSKMKEALDYPEFAKGDRNYDIHLKTYMYLSNRLKQLFVLDWRSEQMGRAVIRQLCAQQEAGKPALPTVAIVGGDHLAHMQEFLEDQGVNASLDMQGASPTSDFEQLLKELKRR